MELNWESGGVGHAVDSPPSNRVDGKHTINMARGMNRKIADRMDLTLECVHRYYSGEIDTPLGATLARYDDFFALFNDFRGYVGFFVLQDLLIDGCVKFFTDFDNFATVAVPGDLATYTRFRDASITFVVARNERIESWAADNLSR